MSLATRAMRYAKRGLRRRIGLSCSVERLISLSGVRLHCPLYHVVREAAPLWWGNRYRIKTTAEFTADMDEWLGWSQPLPLDALLRWGKGEAMKPEGFHLSFDDGYREMAEVIAPILKAKGIPATFFITSSLIDQGRIFFEDHLGLIGDAITRASPSLRDEAFRLGGSPEDLRELWSTRNPKNPRIGELSDLLEIDVSGWLASEQPYLTTPMIEGLIRDGFSIGSHSIDHPVFHALNLEEQEEQVRISTDAIVARFGLNYSVFAFPYGEFGVARDLPSRLCDKGVIDTCFGTRGLVSDDREPLVIQRLWCEGHAGTLDSFVRNAFAQAWAMQ